MQRMEIFRKGQIVPRRLRKVLAGHAKAQHNILFGINVRYENGNFYGLEEMHGKYFIFVRTVGRRHNNGTRQLFGLTVQGVSFWPRGSYGPSLVVGNFPAQEPSHA